MSAIEQCIRQVEAGIVRGVTKEARAELAQLRARIEELETEIQQLEAGCVQYTERAEARISELESQLNGRANSVAVSRCSFCGAPRRESAAVLEENPHCQDCLHERVAQRAAGNANDGHPSR